MSRHRPPQPPPARRSPARRSPARRLLDLARALAALATVGALAAGLPILLWRLAGWPLPHTLPAPAELPGLLTRPIPDQAIANGLVSLVWLWWLHFLVCLTAELTATLRGRTPVRVPAGALTQAIAARLIGAVLLLTPPSSFMQPTAATAPRPAVVRTATLRPATPAAGVTAPATAPATASAAGAPTGTLAADRTPKRYVVRAKQPDQPRDTLWGIAERYLHDPFRWREIEQLNIGRPLPDPPGGHYHGGTLILPGQELLLPADATGLPPTPPPTTLHPQPQPRPPRPQQPSPAPAPPSTTPASPTTPPPPSAAPEPPGPGPASPAPRAPVAAAPGRPASHHPTGAVLPMVAALAGAGLLAAGVIAVLTWRRRLQQRARRAGRRIKLPTGRAAQAELALRVTQEPEAAEFLDLALRALARTARDQHLRLPDVQSVLLGPDWLEVHFTDPADPAEPADPPPAPFVPGGAPDRWRLDRTTPTQELARLAADAPAPLPALVSLGHTDHASVLVNLETAGLVGISGAPANAKAVLDAIAIELATSAWGGFFELLLVGFGEALASLERVRHAATLEELLPGLERRWARARDLLADTDAPSLLAARLASDTPDSLAPTVVLCASLPAPATLQRLATTVKEPAGLPFAAVVTGDDPSLPWRIDVGDDHARLDPVGLRVRPQRLGAETASAIASLLATTADTADTYPTSPPYDTLDHPPAPAPAPAAAPNTAAAAAAPDQPGVQGPAAAAAVEVRVLGPVELHGLPRIRRAKSLELIVYLALHPHGADGERIWEALWPEKPLNRATLHTTVSVARNRLGDTPDGAPYLPDARDGLYRLHPALGLDWTRFQTLTQPATHDHQPVPALRQALELVRGIPLESATPRSYEWAIVHRTEMEAAIGDAAEQLARHYLDAADPSGATWAARRGLLASPYDERLFRQLMLAQDHAGNPAGVDAVMHELLHTLGDDLEPLDDLHPETVTLYKQLRGNRSIIG